MSYKELADAICPASPQPSDATRREIEAILRSLDEQPVATVAEVHMSRYTLEWNGSPQPEGTKLYAAPVAAQTPFAKDSWQHDVDDQLVGFGRTSQEFGSPHEAVRWLIEQEVQAAQPTEQKKCNLISDEDSCQATEIIRCLTCHRHVSGPCNTPAQPQQAKPLSDEEIAFCIFESKMKNPAITRDGTTSIRIARAAIAAFCQKNGIKEQG